MQNFERSDGLDTALYKNDLFYLCRQVCSNFTFCRILALFTCSCSQLDHSQLNKWHLSTPAQPQNLHAQSSLTTYHCPASHHRWCSPLLIHMPIQRRTCCLANVIDWVSSSPTTNEPIRTPYFRWQNTTSDARFHRIASHSADVEQNFDTPNQAFISRPCTTSRYSKSPSFIWGSYKARPYMQLGRITVLSSFSRDCSDILVSGSTFMWGSMFDDICRTNSEINPAHNL